MTRLQWIGAALAAAAGLATTPAAAGVPDFSGVWKGELVNLPGRPTDKPVEVTLEVGPQPDADNSCSPLRHTYREAGVTKGVKDYRLCRGVGPDSLFVDEGDVAEGKQITLPARWIGDVLVSPFKYGDRLLISTMRLRGEVLEEEILVVDDKPATTGVVGLNPRSIQRMRFLRVESARR